MQLTSPSQGPPGSPHRPLPLISSGTPCTAGSGAAPRGRPQSDPAEHLQDTPAQDEPGAAEMGAQKSHLTPSNTPSDLLALAHGQQSRSSRAGSGRGWHISAAAGRSSPDMWKSCVCPWPGAGFIAWRQQPGNRVQGADCANQGIAGLACSVPTQCPRACGCD